MATKEEIKLLLDNGIITVEKAAELLREELNGEAKQQKVKSEKSKKTENEKVEVVDRGAVTPVKEQEVVAKSQKDVASFNASLTLMLFAGFLIGLGIIALVASNWQIIPNEIKLVGAVLLLVTNGGLILWADKKKMPITTKVLCTVYACIIAAVIGLIGQVFHLRSDVGGALLLWGALSWPLIMIMPEMAIVWLIVVWFGGEQKIWDFPEYRFWGRLLLATLLYEGIALYGNKNNKAFRVMSYVILYGLFLLLLSLAFDGIYPMDWRVLLSVAFVMVLVIGANWAQKRMTFMPFIWLGLVVFSQFSWYSIAGLLAFVYGCMVTCGYAYYHKRPRLFKLALVVSVLACIGYYMYDVDNLSEASVGFIGFGLLLILIVTGLRKYGYLLGGEKNHEK